MKSDQEKWRYLGDYEYSRETSKMFILIIHYIHSPLCLLNAVEHRRRGYINPDITYKMDMFVEL